MKNQEYKKYKKRIQIVDSIRKDYKLSENMNNRLLKIVETDYRNNKNKNMYSELIINLPTNSKYNLIKNMYKYIILEHKFFGNQTHEFILTILPLLKQQKCVKNEKIVLIGEFLEEIYLVDQGILGVHLENKFHNIEIGVIRENNYFGDLFLHVNEQSPYLIQCKSKLCTIFILKKKDFLEVKNQFSENFTQIFVQSFKTLEIFNRRKTIYIEFLNRYKTIEIVKDKIKLLNIYLLEKGFDKLFHNNIDVEDVKMMISHSNFNSISTLITKIEKEKSIKFNSSHKKQRKTLYKEKSVNSSDFKKSPVQIEFYESKKESSRQSKKEKSSKKLLSSKKIYDLDFKRDVNNSESVCISHDLNSTVRYRGIDSEDVYSKKNNFRTVLPNNTKLVTSNKFLPIMTKTNQEKRKKDLIFDKTAIQKRNRISRVLDFEKTNLSIMRQTEISSQTLRLLNSKKIKDEIAKQELIELNAKKNLEILKSPFEKNRLGNASNTQFNLLRKRKQSCFSSVKTQYKPSMNVSFSIFGFGAENQPNDPPILLKKIHDMINSTIKKIRSDSLKNKLVVVRETVLDLLEEMEDFQNKKNFLLKNSNNHNKRLERKLDRVYSFLRKKLILRSIQI